MLAKHRATSTALSSSTPLFCRNVSRLLKKSNSSLGDNVAITSHAYRDLLFKQKLLISSNTGPSQHYEITDKGLRYLHIFAELEDNLQPVESI
jgi:predicted transcriptional regulator